MTCLVFLRGINVGGNNKVAMAELRSILESAGFGDVKTYLQSGNIRLSSNMQAPDLKDRLESIISDKFGFTAHALVRSVDDIRSAVDGYDLDESDDNYNHNIVLTEPQAHHDLSNFVAMELVSESESCAIGDRVIYWRVPKGRSTQTDFAKELARAKHRSISTTRTIKTLRRML